MRAERRKQRYQESTHEEREKRFSEAMKESLQWRQRRVEPVYWRKGTDTHS